MLFASDHVHEYARTFREGTRVQRLRGIDCQPTNQLRRMCRLAKSCR